MECTCLSKYSGIYIIYIHTYYIYIHMYMYDAENAVSLGGTVPSSYWQWMKEMLRYGNVSHRGVRWRESTTSPDRTMIRLSALVWLKWVIMLPLETCSVAEVMEGERVFSESRGGVSENNSSLLWLGLLVGILVP